MYLKQVVILLFLYLNHCHCASKVWLYKNCGKDGFTCISKNKRATIIYQCPAKNKEYHFFVNEFNGPANIESLIIKNCKSLTVYFRCTTFRTERKNLQYLEISNVDTLKIERVPTHHSQLPPTVVLENIKLIESIPSYSFSQIHALRNKRCISPRRDFHSISFRNVTVDTAHSNAFHMPSAFGNAAFINSRINKFHTSSMLVHHDGNGVFTMRGSTVGVVYPSAIRATGKTVIFSENKFEKISSGGINVTAEGFYFANNSVNTLQPYALSIFSVDTFILKNRFVWMKARALEKIGPRLTNNSGGKGNVYSYEFSGNEVNSTEADCLHPNTLAYGRVTSTIAFKRNILPCTCSNADWLISTVDNGQSTSNREAFYHMAFSDESENMCLSSCNLPITFAKSILQENPCPQNSTIETLCQNPETTTTISTDNTSKGYTKNFPTTEKSIFASTDATRRQSSYTKLRFNTFTMPSTGRTYNLPQGTNVGSTFVKYSTLSTGGTYQSTERPLSTVSQSTRRQSPQTKQRFDTFTMPSTAKTYHLTERANIGSTFVKYSTSSTGRTHQSTETPIIGTVSVKYVPKYTTVRRNMSPRVTTEVTTLYTDNNKSNIGISSPKMVTDITVESPSEESTTKINIEASGISLEVTNFSYKQECSLYLNFIVFCLVYYVF